MAAKDVCLVYMAFLAFGMIFMSMADGLDPPEVLQFEAAFQGRCGRWSPCAQLCRELHDGTYECGCRPGHILHKDGYSCQELNSTSKLLSDNYIDSEEDVLYQKDASFSAELDIALVPIKETENTTSSNKDTTVTSTETITTMPSFRYFQTQSVNFNEDSFKHKEEYVQDEILSNSERSNKYFDSNTIPYYHETNSQSSIKHGAQGTPLYTRAKDRKSAKTLRQSNIEDVLIKSTVESAKDDLDKDRYKLYKEIEGLDRLRAEGLTSKDIDMIANAALDGAENRKPLEDDERTLITTTLGPSLEQKVPPFSTSGPGHTESAPRSGCPLGKMGPNCDRVAPPPIVPRFSGGSWLALPALRGAYKRVHLHMEFRPTSRDGLLLLTGERADMAGDYLVLLLHRGYVKLIFDCGSGPGVVRSDTSVMLNQWNSLTLYRRRWDAWLQLNGGRHVQGRSKGLFSRMTFLDPVYVGGRGNMSGLEKLPVQSGYDGCVRSLNINGRSYSWSAKPKGDALGGFNIAECSIGGCGRGCLHGGRCLKRCLCPLGFAGDYCQTVLDLQVPRFNGTSFLRYPGMGDSALSWLELQVTLKPTAKTGLIMYNAHRSDGVGDFFSLYLKDGHAEFSFDLGTGQATIRSPKEMKLNSWYTISVSRTGRLAVLTVVSYGLTTDPDESSGLITSQGLAPGAFTQLSLSQNLYLGGAPQMQIVQKRISINESFNGCIQKVVINDHEQTIVSSALGGVNIDGCPHACTAGPCGTASCKPHLHHYTCICSPGDENEKCTVFLNETDIHTDYISRKSYYLSEPERVQFLQSDDSILDKHTSIVPKKGPKLTYKRYNEYDQIIDDNKHEEMDLDSKQKAQRDFNDRNKEIGEQEWILSKNYDRNQNEFKNKDDNPASIDGDNIKIYDLSTDKPKDVWSNEMPLKFYSFQEIHPELIMEIPNFEGENSFIRNSDPDILNRLSSHSVDINIRFKSIKSHGLLLWLGKDGMIPGDTFMALAIENGLLTFRYDLGSGEVIIVANQTKVDNGLWHRARAARKGQSGVLDIDGLGAVGKVSPGHIRPLNIDTGLYIGGMPSIWPETLGRYKSGLEGCISMLTLDREFQIPLNLKSHKHTTSRNVGKCPP